MLLFGNNVESGLELYKRLDPKYAPAFEKFSSEDKASLAWYFLPHSSRKDVLGVTRPRVIKWYCPFADQKDFPSGHRYCINVYAGCSHNCRYCYAQGYEPNEAKCKDGYKKKLLKDLSEIEDFNLPPAPLHLSNSTDPLQPLELKQRFTLYTLEQVCKYRKYFTTITLLTKNPAILTEPAYLKALKILNELPEDLPGKDSLISKSLPGLRVEVSVAFHEQQNATFYDPGAPTIASRLSAIKTLRKTGIAVVLRIDPLLPRNPLPNGKTLNDFQLPDAQSLSSLESLVHFAKKNQICHVVYSVAKVVVPRYKPMTEQMNRLKQVYEYLADGNKLVFRGGSWRLPQNIAKTHIVDPFIEICNKYDMKACFCKQNLLETP
jgi:DNA repair photolyase